jgi:hypothetical protein
MIGKRSSMRIAMNSRGINGKWNAMWHSSQRRSSHRVLRPLVRLGQQHAVRELFVHVLAEHLQEGVGLGQVLADRALTLVEVGHRVQPQAVDAHPEPEVQHRSMASAPAGCRS